MSAGTRGFWVRMLVPVGVLALFAVQGASCSPGNQRPGGRDPDSASLPAADAAEKAPKCRRTLVGVAHQDDDLFFIDPETRKTLRAGCPVTTVYLTAGDGGKRNPEVARDYVHKRENGVRAAYAELAGVPDRWTADPVRVNGRSVRSFRLDGGPARSVRLTFMGLHDGHPSGRSPESMLRLFLGTRESIRLFQSEESYTEEQLLETLSGLARQMKAERILTLDYDHASFAFGLRGNVDHSDHGIGARYFRKAGYISGIPVTSYLGYTMSRLKPNLPPDQVSAKESSVRRYLAQIGCRPPVGCLAENVYEGALQGDDVDWSHRQYQQVHRDPRPGEIMGDIGRTTVFSGRNPEQCLEAVNPSPAAGSVRINGCDGSDAQKWDVTGAGAIRTQRYGGYCLTLLPDTAGLARCQESGAAQKWTLKPWKSATWKRAAWRIAGEGGMCLYQNDRELPPRWDSRTDQHPVLGLADCGDRTQPELYWRRHG
ncbi:ricin-type beta-trefoil lectin domain protein [Streptomyces sp. NPDC004726]